MGNYETRMRLISETNVNVANNTSYVTVAFDFRRTDYSYYGYNLTGDAYWNIKVDSQSTGNVKFTYNWSFGQNVWKEVARRSFTVTHNADGKKSISMSGTIYFGAGVSPGTLTGSGSAALSTIPRATTPTLSPASQDAGSAITINLPRASSSFTHKLTYKFGNASGTIATAAGASQSWTLPASLAAQIPNTTSGTGVITCETYNGSTLIGTKTVNFTATVPSSMVPSVGTVAVSEAVAGLNAQFGAYVQHKSQLKISISASGVQGSSVTAYKTEVGGRVYSGNSFTSDPISLSGTIPVKVTITDRRGRTATKTQNVSAVAYSNPSIVSFSALRCSSDGTVNEQGTSMKITMNFGISNVGDKNTKSYVVELLKSGTTTWSKVVSGSVYSYNSTYIADNVLSIDSSYVLRLKISDYFTTSEAKVDINTGFTLMDFRSTGKGLAFGKASEKDALEVDMNAELKKTISVAGAATFGGASTFSGKATFNGGLSGTLTGTHNGTHNGTTVGGLNGYIVTQVIPANADLNSYNSETRFYYCPSNATVATLKNCPTNNAFYMWIGRHAGVFQFLVTYVTSGQQIFTRNYYNGAWGSWRQLEFFTGNSIGTAVNLINNTSYTFPCDGYLYLECNYRQGYYLFMDLYGANGVTCGRLNQSSPNSQGCQSHNCTTTYVKKGMYITGITTNNKTYNKLRFYPFQ